MKPNQTVAHRAGTVTNASVNELLDSPVLHHVMKMKTHNKSYFSEQIYSNNSSSKSSTVCTLEPMSYIVLIVIIDWLCHQVGQSKCAKLSSLQE